MLDIRLVAALAAAALSTGYAGLAVAQSKQEPLSKWYVVAGAGRTVLETDFQETRSTIGQTGATAFTVSDYENTTMWKALVGYRLGEHFAVEIGHWNFGNARYTARVAAPVASTFQRSLRISSLGTDLVYWHKPRDTFTTFGKVGVLFSRVKAGAVEPGPGLTAIPSDTVLSNDLHLGAGLAYRISARLTGRLEYDYVKKVGDKDRFGVAHVQAISAALQLNF